MAKNKRGAERAPEIVDDTPVVEAPKPPVTGLRERQPPPNFVRPELHYPGFKDITPVRLLSQALAAQKAGGTILAKRVVSEAPQVSEWLVGTKVADESAGEVAGAADGDGPDATEGDT